MARPRKENQYLIAKRNDVIAQLLREGFSQTEISVILRLPRNTVNAKANSFYKFLKPYCGEDSPYGDFADDVYRDKNRPNSSGYAAWYIHVGHTAASQTFKELYKIYKAVN